MEGSAGVNNMDRESVTEDQLLAHLNSELGKLPDSKDFRFTSVTRLVEADDTGCNWSNVWLRNSGGNTKAILSDAKRIVTKAQGRFNLETKNKYFKIQ